MVQESTQTRLSKQNKINKFTYLNKPNELNNLINQNSTNNLDVNGKLCLDVISPTNSVSNNLTSTKNTRIFSSKLKTVASLEGEIYDTFKRESHSGSLQNLKKDKLFL